MGSIPVAENGDGVKPVNVVATEPPAPLPPTRGSSEYVIGVVEDFVDVLEAQVDDLVRCLDKAMQDDLDNDRRAQLQEFIGEAKRASDGLYWDHIDLISDLEEGDYVASL